MHVTDRKAYLALGIVCIVWGVSWVGTKEAVRYMPPIQMVGIRQTLAGLAYVAFFMIRGDKLPRKKEWYPIIFLSVLNFMISNGFATIGVKLTTAGLSAIIGAIFPLWLVLILAFRGKNKIPPLAWVGILVGFSGVCIVFYEHLRELFNYAFLGGILLGLVASLSWAYGTIYTKEFSTNFNPYHSIGWQMLISGITMSLIAKATGEVIPVGDIKLYTWGAILFLVIVSSIIAFLAYLYALQKLPTGLVSVYAYVNPIVAVLSGSLFTGEPFTALIITGSLVTLTGVYIVNRALNKKQVATTPQLEA
jgi:drug/metabolite transporter (DMT)-like permease